MSNSVFWCGWNGTSKNGYLVIKIARNIIQKSLYLWSTLLMNKIVTPILHVFSEIRYVNLIYILISNDRFLAFLWPKHYAKYFTYINSLNPHNEHPCWPQFIDKVIMTPRESVIRLMTCSSSSYPGLSDLKSPCA